MENLKEIDLTDAFVELVRKAATDLPADMEQAISKAKGREEPGSAAEGALDTILNNVNLARENSTPICQDTGTPIFEIYYPVGVSTRSLSEQIRHAVAEATEQSYLRPNAVDSLTGKNSGDNTGEDFPTEGGEMRKAVNAVYMDAEHPSALLLPVRPAETIVAGK